MVSLLLLQLEVAVERRHLGAGADHRVALPLLRLDPKRELAAMAKLRFGVRAR